MQENLYTHYVGIQFQEGARAYFFGMKDIELKVGDKVIVETARGLELGEVSIAPIEIKNYSNTLELKPIIRKANESDIKINESNKKDAENALIICENEVKNLKLDMRLISCEYTLDKTKVIFSYLADERVDFRELLKVLAYKLHTRIELRQIGTRDKAKMIGGIGMCGLKLCCSTFLNEFDGISINRAKNQMLAINIPKLSGHCGKLLCCLKFEDDAYTEERKKYPGLGEKVKIDNVEYIVNSINIVSTVIRLDGGEDQILYLPLEEFRKQTGQNEPRKKEFRFFKKNNNDKK